MKHIVILAGFGLVAVAMYLALKDKPAPEPGALQQPVAPGFNPSV